MPVNKNFKHKARMIRAARLEALGFPDAQIASHIGLTTAGLATLKQDPLYKEIQVTQLTHVLGVSDEELASNTQELREILKEQVPAALSTMAELIAQRTDPKLAFQVAESVLDRDGRFMKASRTVVTPEEELPSYLSQKDDETVNRIAAAQSSSLPNIKPASEKVQ